MGEIEAELDTLADLRKQAADTIRLTAGKHAADTVLWPAVARLMTAYPDILVEVSVDSPYVDLVAQRFDAGLRLGERVETDMVALPVGQSLRTAVVASPAYLARCGEPRSLADLAHHRCIGFRDACGDCYAWEFEKDGREVSVRVNGGPVFNDGDLMVAAAAEGLGLAHLMEDQVVALLDDGRLSRVMEDWCAPFPGYHLHYPSRGISAPGVRPNTVCTPTISIGTKPEPITMPT